MTRVEYIRQLEFSLSGKLPKKEISEILRDYSEYFEAGKAEGKTEEEIAAKLGIPYAVAGQILSENEEQPETPEKRKWFAGGGKATEQNAGPQEEGARPRLTAADGAFEPKRAWAGIKAWFHRMTEWFSGLFRREDGGGAAATPPGGSPSSADTAPAAAPQRHSLARWVGGALLFLLLLPVIVLALFFGAALLACVAVAFVGAAVFFFAGFLASLAALLAGAFAIALAGGILPESAVVLLVFFFVGCLAAGILSLCLCAWTFRGLGRFIRYCFGRGKYLRSARNPAYQAQRNAASPPPSGPEPEGAEGRPAPPKDLASETEPTPDGVAPDPEDGDLSGPAGAVPDVPEKEENGNA